jgi:hypothetical protein
MSRRGNLGETLQIPVTLVRQGQVPRLLSVLGGDSMLGVPIKAELAQRRRLIHTVQQ